MFHFSSKILALAALVALSACGGGGSATAAFPATANGAQLPDATHNAASLRAASSVAGRVPADSNAGILINAGGGSVGAWSADTDYSSGAFTATVSNGINTSNVQNPAPQSVYQSQRTAPTLTYTVPGLSAWSTYTVRLHLVESFFSARGQRVFNVEINGSRVLSNYDIYAAAGGANIAVAPSFSVQAAGDGRITIHASATTNYASIAGVEIGNGGSSSPSTPQPDPPSNGWNNSFPGFAGNRPLPSNPQIHPQSQQMMDTLYSDAPSFTGSGLNDTTSTFYSSTNSDPVHYVHCQYAYGPAPSHQCVLEGQQIHVPSGAVPSANSDRHTSILAPDGCTLYDFWLASDLNAGTITTGFAAMHNLCTENGFNAHGGGGTTAAGASQRLGRSTLAEMRTGVIHHALAASAGCDLSSDYVGQAIYPGQYQACRPGVGGVGIPMGAYLWSDVRPDNLPDGLDKATRMICTALNKYGAVLEDTNSNWNGISIMAFWSKVNTPGYADWFAQNARSDGSVNPQACFPGGDWPHHMHVLQW